MHIPLFDAEQAQKLTQFCQQAQHCLHDYHFVHGQLFAVAAAPEIPMPQEWMMWAFSDPQVSTTADEADEITLLLMSLFQFHLRNMRDDKLELPGFCVAEDIRDTHSAVALWFQGILSVHQKLEPVWQAAWNKMPEDHSTASLSKSLRHALSMFSTFADVPLALERLPADKRVELEQHLPQVFAALPQSLQSYVGVSGELATFLPDQFETFEHPGPAPDGQ